MAICQRKQVSHDRGTGAGGSNSSISSLSSACLAECVNDTHCAFAAITAPCDMAVVSQSLVSYCGKGGTV